MRTASLPRRKEDLVLNPCASASARFTPGARNTCPGRALDLCCRATTARTKTWASSNVALLTLISNKKQILTDLSIDQLDKEYGMRSGAVHHGAD